MFSTEEDDLGLYGKPMARNVQLWTRDHSLLLDGPRASRDDIRSAVERVVEGGLFGYRFQFPPLRVGRHEIYWHRPLVAYLDHVQSKPAVLPDAPLGYLTAYRASNRTWLGPSSCGRGCCTVSRTWKRCDLFQHAHDQHYRQTALNVRLLLDTWHLRGETSVAAFAGAATAPARSGAFPGGVVGIAAGTVDWTRCAASVWSKRWSNAWNHRPMGRAAAPKGTTFAATARRSFEVNYWKKIAFLSEGRFVTKCNADYIDDKPTQETAPITCRAISIRWAIIC